MLLEMETGNILMIKILLAVEMTFQKSLLQVFPLNSKLKFSSKSLIFWFKHFTALYKNFNVKVKIESIIYVNFVQFI